MTRITEAERVFLSRAEAVTEKKHMHAAHYEQQLQGMIEELPHVDVLAELQLGDVSKFSMQILKTTKKGIFSQRRPIVKLRKGYPRENSSQRSVKSSCSRRHFTCP